MKTKSVLLFLLLSAFLISSLASCQPEKVTYHVTFDAGEEEFSEAQKSYFSQGINVYYDSKITIPESASKDDQAIYNSDGTKVVDSWLWKEGNKEWNFSTLVRDDVTLIAQWKEATTE